MRISCPSLFFFADPPPTDIYTLSLHDALPIFALGGVEKLTIADAGDLDGLDVTGPFVRRFERRQQLEIVDDRNRDRKSTRLNSSHEWISYAVFCLKKKKDNG